MNEKTTLLTSAPRRVLEFYHLSANTTQLIIVDNVEVLRPLVDESYQLVQVLKFLEVVHTFYFFLHF